MAIRKITELPLVEPLNKEIRSNLSGSYMEISLQEDENSGQGYRFASKKIKYSDMEKSIIYPVVGDVDNEVNVNFHSLPYFYKSVNALDGLNLSGDFYVNWDIDDEDVESYSTVIKTGNVNIESVNDIVLNATKNVHFKNNNVIFGIELESPNVIIRDTSITLNKPTNISNTLDVAGKTTVVDLSCAGNAKFDNTIDGTALKAKWADLAEMYDSDSEYEPGTLVKFGGEKEITIATDEVNAVITTKPGLLLGENDTNTKLPIALVGKVPVKVIGSVKKFDKLVLSDVPGIAIKKNDETKTVIGISLNTIDCKPDEINLVESVVQLKF